MEKFSGKKFIKDINKPENGFVPDQIINKRSLGKGGYGQVFEVELKKDSHSKNFALKKFNTDHTERGNEIARLFTERDFQTYKKVKEAGIKVFTTLRISENHQELLMTLGTTEDFTLISKDSHITWEKVNKITNLEILLSQIQNNILKAMKAGITLPNDGYFFVIENSHSTDVDFLVGDYGGVSFDTIKKNNADIYFIQNISGARTALNRFLESYMIKEKVEEYKELVDNNLKKFGEEHVSGFEFNKYA